MADRPTEDTVAIPRATTPASGTPAPARGSNGAASRPASAAATSATTTAASANGAATRTAPVLPPPPPAVAPEAAQPTAPPAPVAPPAPTRQEKRAAKAAAREAAAARAAATAKPRGRKARLRLTRVDPWSVMKTAFLLSIALGVVTVVSVLMVWTVLGAADVWQSIDKTVRDIVGGQDASTFSIQDYIGTRRVVGFTMIVSAVDVVLVTAIATLGAFLYNMSASLLGGIEVTLSEDA